MKHTCVLTVSLTWPTYRCIKLACNTLAWRSKLKNFTVFSDFKAAHTLMANWTWVDPSSSSFICCKYLVTSPPLPSWESCVHAVTEERTKVEERRKEARGRKRYRWREREWESKRGRERVCVREREREREGERKRNRDRERKKERV